MKKNIKNVFSFYDFSEEKSEGNNFFFICDHASNYIPKRYNNLGLSKRHLKSHISWDLGVKSLTIKLAKHTKSACFLGKFSRLLIDPNRSLEDRDLICSSSFKIKIPSNSYLTEKEKKERIRRFYKTYHQYLEKKIKKKLFLNKNLKLLSIHSFTKSGKNFDRPTELGLLWNNDISLMLPIKKGLLKNKINVGCNKPYSGFFFNHTLDEHGKKNNIKNLCIEVRNDLICDEKGIKKWSRIILKQLKKIKNI